MMGLGLYYLKWNFNPFPIWSKPASIIGGAEPAGDEVEVSRKDVENLIRIEVVQVSMKDGYSGKTPGKHETSIDIPVVTSPAIQGQTQISERQASTSLEILKSIVYGGLMEVIASLSIVAFAVAADATTRKSNE
ncbi:hypothetical protein L2E82_29495 [Cichorium intybus]|uniref:Uncharacterized protein n=1 Tax=Cichorium intybus TaxID=13427 RepID=A0ACB9CXN3_CICIN|nr:hypothetical protein L2E82_29495 [Cichorium intybus]